MDRQDFNLSLLDATYKDDSPVKTVEKINDILKKYNIKTTAKWNESNVEHCYSVRLDVDGTAFGVNGKGLTKEFAFASAHGELMERMQLGLFGDSSVQKLGHFMSAIGEDKELDAEELYEQIPNWYDDLASRVNQIDGTQKSGKELILEFANEDEKLSSTSFYNLMNGKTVYIPREIRCLACGSNGGAAGNTMEEAVVQALSEIMERYHKLKIIKEGTSLPDIPENVLKKFPVVYKIIESIRNKGLNVFVKDCSLGKRFPVVCVYYIDKKTGRYHTHFGAYPILEIALERTLTETFQGRKIETFAKNEDFIYNFDDVDTYRSTYKELKKGNFDKAPEFFIGECKYSYNDKMGFDGKNNSELLSQLVKYFAELGKEILVRNGSSLGFPTYNVVVPGYSEILMYSLSKKQSGFVNAKEAARILRNLNDASFEDYVLLLAHFGEMKKLVSLKEDLFSFANCANLPFKCDRNNDSYLLSASLAYVYYGIGNLEQTLAFVGKMIPFSKKEDIGYLVCLKRYLAMLLNGDDDNKIRSLLEQFHASDVVRAIYTHIENGTNPLGEFVLHCDGKSCEACLAGEWCTKRYTESLISIVHEGAKKLDFNEFIERISKYKLS